MDIFNPNADNQQQQPQQKGLLDDLDPASRMMVAMAFINKFTGNNRASQSGFGDIFSLMTQQQQMKRQQQMDALNYARFGLEQKQYGLQEQKFGMDKELTQAQIKSAQQEAQAKAARQADLNNIAEGVKNYQAPGAEIAPVIPEYESMQAPQPTPMGSSPLEKSAGQSLPTPTPSDMPMIPTQGYLNNLFSAADQARANPPKGAFIKDPQVREQAAALIRSGDPALVKQGYDLLQQGGPFTINDTRYTGTGDAIVTAPNKDTEAKAGQQRFGQNKDMRGEYIKLSESNENVFAANTRIAQFRDLKDPQPPDDAALVLNVMKMMNPTIRINEGAIDYTTETPGVPEWLMEQYYRSAGNQKMSPDSRKRIFETSDRLHQAAIQTQQSVDERYSNLATRAGLDPTDVIDTKRSEGFKKRNTQSQVTQVPAGMVSVITPEGREAFIPQENLEKALSIPGFKRK
jgi:hypothetical protein